MVEKKVEAAPHPELHSRHEVCSRKQLLNEYMQLSQEIQPEGYRLDHIYGMLNGPRS